MSKVVLRSAALALLLGASALPLTAANALLTYTSALEYKDVGGTATKAATPYGFVTLQELDAYNVKVTVTLNDPLLGFINSGGPHDPFLYNTTGDYVVTVTNTGTQTFYDGGHNTTPDSNGPNFAATPFGTFTDRIGCCNDQNGTGKKSVPPIVFNVYDANGITFAGIGATYDSGGRLLTLGTGDHFVSNTSGALGGGWWFAADVTDGTNTFNIAARDAFTDVPGVPEPASWAMMVGGFAMVGGALRSARRRSAVTFA